MAAAKQLFYHLWYDENCNCQLCGRAGGPICPECNQLYFHPELARCQNCGKLLPAGRRLCRDCLDGKAPLYLTQVFVWGHYDGAWRELIQRVKFQAQPFRLSPLAKPLGMWASRNLPPVDALVPVPMHASRLADRGFNQTEVIASLLHWELGIPLLQALERTAPTTSQVLLTRKERLTNLNGAFRLIIPGLQGQRICLVDDVTTTGATLQACARELRTGGVEEIYAFCLAAGMEKSLVQPGD